MVVMESSALMGLPWGRELLNVIASCGASEAEIGFLKTKVEAFLAVELPSPTSLCSMGDETVLYPLSVLYRFEAAMAAGQRLIELDVSDEIYNGEVEGRLLRVIQADSGRDFCAHVLASGARKGATCGAVPLAFDGHKGG